MGAVLGLDDESAVESVSSGASGRGVDWPQLAGSSPAAALGADDGPPFRSHVGWSAAGGFGSPQQTHITRMSKEVKRVMA